jgi:hypothetical protein
VSPFACGCAVAELSPEGTSRRPRRRRHRPVPLAMVGARCPAPPLHRTTVRRRPARRIVLRIWHRVPRTQHEAERNTLTGPLQYQQPRPARSTHPKPWPAVSAPYVCDRNIRHPRQIPAKTAARKRHRKRSPTSSLQAPPAAEQQRLLRRTAHSQRICNASTQSIGRRFASRTHCRTRRVIQCSRWTRLEARWSSGQWCSDRRTCAAVRLVRDRQPSTIHAAQVHAAELTASVLAQQQSVLSSLLLLLLLLLLSAAAVRCCCCCLAPTPRPHRPRQPSLAVIYCVYSNIKLVCYIL